MINECIDVNNYEINLLIYNIVVQINYSMRQKVKHVIYLPFSLEVIGSLAIVFNEEKKN